MTRLKSARRTFKRIVQSAQAFIALEAAGGFVLVAAAIVGLLWANSPVKDAYDALWHAAVSLDAGVFHLDEDLRHIVNDGLMTLFFLLVGLEIKRELVHGELSSPRKALLPALAALGGMLAPALLYLLLNQEGASSTGWGIPMATDIAFALGVLSLLGRRVPLGAKVFLLALAIADDIGAIVVIAVAYTSHLDMTGLAIALGLLASVFVAGRLGVRSPWFYLLGLLLIWPAAYESGVHATLAGVALGLLTPASTPDDVDPPLDHLERLLHPVVSYAIVPLFALANAGVVITGDAVSAAVASRATLGVILGLVVGKPVGILVVTWLAVRLGVAELPAGATWSHVLGLGMLGGVGFTVSLLIAGLAFDDAALVEESKLGVLVASVLASAAGFLFLRLTSSGSPRSD